MQFAKYHGLGNDFIVVDIDKLPAEFSGQKARRLCDRHFGIGADGVLVVGNAPREGLDGEMTIYNADGSMAEMCGNGIRCVAFHLLRNGIKKKEMAILTQAGIKTCTVVGRQDEDPLIQVAMGQIVFQGPDLPACDEGQVHTTLELSNGESIQCIPASAGNPHAVIRLSDNTNTMDEARRLGPLVESHAAFPNRTNAEFISQTGPDTFEVTVYERGVGITLACGTGATAAACVAMTHWDAPEQLELTLPGGVLKFAKAEDGQILMTGPATYVYTGQWQW